MRLSSGNVVLAVCLTAAVVWAGSPRPNVIIIYGDDVGFADVGVNGSEQIPTPNIDSRDTLDALLGKNPEGLDYMIEEAGGLAIRSGQWKYVEPQKMHKQQGRSDAMLFNLKDDPSEQNNIALQHPEKTEALQALLKKARAGGRRAENLRTAIKLNGAAL
jgi:arylsulfatase A-like enzyme